MNDPENTPERYRIKWPNGTMVLDTRSNFRFVAKEGQLSYVHDEDIYEIVLDEVYEAQAKEPNSPAVSPDANEPDEVVTPVEKKPTNLPIGGVAPAVESGKSLSPFWKLAGVLVLVAFVAGFVVYRRRQVHPKG